MKKSLKKVLSLIIVMAFVFSTIITTQGFAASKSAKKASPTTITFWNGFGGSDRPILESLVKKFNSSQNDVQIKMEIMDWSILYQKLTTSAASDKGPDFICFGPENIATYANMGAIVPVDDFYANKMINTALLPKGYNQLLKYKNHYIGIPMNYFSHALFYNKDLAKKAGLDPNNPPKTFAQMEDWAVKLTDSKNSQYGLGMPVGWVHIPQLMWAYGGDVMNYSNKTSMLTKPETVEAMKWIVGLENKKVCPAPNADLGKMFAAGKLGMMFDGPWNTPLFKTAKINYGVTLMPTGPKKQITFGAGLSFHLTKKGSDSQATKQAFYMFAQWWFQKDTQKEWASKIGFPPIRTDLVNDQDLIKANPDLKVFMQSSRIGQPWLIGIVNSQKILSDVITKYFDEIIMNHADVDTTLSKADADLNKILSTEK